MNSSCLENKFVADKNRSFLTFNIGIYIRDFKGLIQVSHIHFLRSEQDPDGEWRGPYGSLTRTDPFARTNIGQLSGFSAFAHYII